MFVFACTLLIALLFCSCSAKNGESIPASYERETWEEVDQSTSYERETREEIDQSTDRKSVV